EQLLRVGAVATRAAQFARGGQGQVEPAVGSGSTAFAAAGGGGGAGVEDLLGGHGGLLGWGRSGASGEAYCAAVPRARAAVASGKLGRASGQGCVPVCVRGCVHRTGMAPVIRAGRWFPCS